MIDNFMTLRRVWIAIICGLHIAMFSLVSAQTTVNPSAQAPDHSVSQLESLRDGLGENSKLSEEDLKTARSYYERAIVALNQAREQIENGDRFKRALEQAPETQASLKKALNEARTSDATSTGQDDSPMTQQNLARMQQAQIAKEGELRTLQAELARDDLELQALITRPVEAREEMRETESQLVDVKDSLDDLGRTQTNALERARRALLEDRQYFLRARRYALEQEIAGLTERQQIISDRRDLTSLRARKVEAELIALQTKTGQRRLLAARRLMAVSVESVAEYENRHPFIVAYARENLGLTERLIDIAASAGSYPAREAETRRQLTEVEAGQSTADELIELGNLNRQSSATLRRIRSQIEPLDVVKGELRDTRSAVNTAIQDRLLIQDQLRNFPVGALDIDKAVAEWRLRNPVLVTPRPINIEGENHLQDVPQSNGDIEHETSVDGTLTDVEPDIDVGDPSSTPELTPREIRTIAADLSQADIADIRRLHGQRRTLLQEMSEASANRAAKSVNLQNLQIELLNKTEKLTQNLDQKLLWLPSVEPVSATWPLKALRGFQKLFHPERLQELGHTLFADQRVKVPITIAFCLLILLVIASRKRLWQDVVERSSKVGRVQQDSYWHTPAVIFSSFLQASPIPLVFVGLGILFQISETRDAIVGSLSVVCFYLAFFIGFFLVWREMDRDEGLFDTHFRMSASIRHAVNAQLKWFVPITATAMALIIISDNNDPDIYEGVGLLAFVSVALFSAVFLYKVLWRQRRNIGKILSNDKFFARNLDIILCALIVLPLFTAVLAVIGYFDTANELLARILLSGQLVIITYLIYGIIRRTVQIAQRRLSLAQAIERREVAIQARREKEDAEERGETAPPQINYKEIDIKTISQQTSQLLVAFMMIGFAILMWMVWRDLMPALGVLNDIELWNYAIEGKEGEKIEIPITLWNLIQSLIIVIFTFIAAKNLPGFMEVFLLNRTRLEAGTKYAVKTVLGYFIFVVGIVIAFDRLGTQWSQLQWVVAALGLGIGFGLQEIIANFISGLIILFERPVRVGDYVTIGDQSGNVSRIQIRATTLSDLDNREVLIPNKELITGRVTNWTLSNSVTRLTIPVGVAYGTDTDRTATIIMEVVKNNQRVLDAPGPQVLFVGFGDSSLNFEIRVFLRSFEDRWPVRHAIHTEVNKALAAEGISIPFPQRDLHIITQPGVMAPDAVPSTSEAKAPPKRKPAAKAKASKPRPKKS